MVVALILVLVFFSADALVGIGLVSLWLQHGSGSALGDFRNPEKAPGTGRLSEAAVGPRTLWTQHKICIVKPRMVVNIVQTCA